MTASFRAKPEPLVIALCEASARGDVNNIASLVASGANTQGRDENGKTPIVRAIEAGQCEAVKCLLDNGASISACDTAKKLPPLFHAAESGDVRITALLLSYGCNPRERTVWGNPYIMETVAQGNKEILTLLFNNGADIHMKDVWGREMITIAVQKGDLDMVRFLQQRGGNVNARDAGGSPLVVLALQDNRADMLQFLLERGADANAKSLTGTPMIVDALRRDRMDLVEVLLSRGANPNSRDLMSNPLLFIVIKNGKWSTQQKLAWLQLFFKHGADPNEKQAIDNWGTTVMSYLLQKGMTELAEPFIAKGANPNQTLSTGDTILLHAIQRKHKSLINTLLQCGADPNLADGKGRTPLLQALKCANFVLAERLVRLGADVSREGMLSPQDIAKIMGHEDFAQLLAARRKRNGQQEERPAASRPVTRGRGQPDSGPQSSSGPDDPPPDYNTAAKAET